MNGNSRPFVARYGLASLTYLAASVGTTLFWDPLFQHVPFALFFAAVSATAWFSGFRQIDTKSKPKEIAISVIDRSFRELVQLQS